MSEEKLSFEKLAPFLLLLVIVLSFVIGILWQKVRALEKGVTGSKETSGAEVADTTTAQGNEFLSIDSLKSYAKELGLNEGDFNSCLDEGKYAQKVSEEVDQAIGVGVTGTPAFFVNGILISGAQPYQIFADTFDFELKGGDWSNPDDKVAYLVDDNAQNGEISISRKTVDIGDSPVKGDSNAKVTLVEFSDFECTFCEKFFSQTLPMIEEKYVDTGKVKMVYKQFPLQFHPNAQKAAEASLCAKDQGKFWEMHDLIFKSAGS